MIADDVQVSIKERFGERVEIDRDSTPPWEHYIYTVTVSLFDQSMTFPFRTGTGWTKRPTRLEVLQSLANDLAYARDYDLAALVDELGMSGKQAVEARGKLDRAYADAHRVFQGNIDWFITTFEED